MKLKNTIVSTIVTTLVLAGLISATIGCRHTIKKELRLQDGPDDGGSLIGAVKLTPESSYVGVPELLEKYIREEDDTAWVEIEQKVYYTYRALGFALWPVLEKDNLQAEILAELDVGKKLFIKANFMNPKTLELTGDGSPGTAGSVNACTNWVFVAALMRFFHDELGVRYYQMAIGDAGTLVPAYSTYLNCAPEAFIEGTPYGVAGDYWAGWGLYFVRKYLSRATTPHDSKDDPLNGYTDSIKGNYITPGQATKQGKLMVYDLNNAEEFDRGRRVSVPDGGDNHKEGLVIHKALVGDPADRENYPGSVILNPPVLKIHIMSIFSAATKNLGMGGLPMCAGQDSEVKSPDWLYSYPPADLPTIKHRYHDKWFALDFNEEGVPLKITDKPNMGIDGTVVDTNLAIKSQVPLILHTVDAVTIIDIDHSGFNGSVPIPQGLIFASTDPVALDLLCARYMFKNLPSNPNNPDKFARTVPIPRYDETAGVIVSHDGVDERVSRSTIFKYAAKRGLGKLNYYVEGKDVTSTASKLLASKNGHLGKIEDGKFVEVMNDHFFTHGSNNIHHLQPSVLAHAQATDQLSGSKYYEEFMAADDDTNHMIDDSEFGKGWRVDGAIAPIGIAWGLIIAKGEPEQANLFINSRFLKFSDSDWNEYSFDILMGFMDQLAFSFAYRMAMDEKNEGTDLFFDIPYGAVGGMHMWPSLQFARYRLDMLFIHDVIYPNAAAYSKKTGKGFKLYLPNRVPYAPPSPPGQQPWSYNPKKMSNIIELDPTHPNYSKLVFTAEFGDETW